MSLPTAKEVSKTSQSAFEDLKEKAMQEVANKIRAFAKTGAFQANFSEVDSFRFSKVREFATERLESKGYNVFRDDHGRWVASWKRI